MSAAREIHERILTPPEAEAVARVRRAIWSYIIVAARLANRKPGSMWRWAIDEQLDMLHRATSRLHRTVIVACTTMPHAANDLPGAGAAAERLIDDLMVAFRAVPESEGAETDPLTQHIDRQLASLTDATALQLYGLRVSFGRSADGEETVAWEQLTESEHDRAMLSTTLRQLETLIADDPLLALERRACQWYFFRSATPPRSKKSKRALRRREREWAICDRRTVASGTPMLELTAKLEKTKDYTRRQRRVTAAMGESVSGVFSVHAQHGDTVPIENVTGGSRYLLRADGLDSRWAAGDFLHGRIIPSDDGRWVHTKSTARVNRELVERWRPTYAAMIDQSIPCARAFDLERTLSEVGRGSAPSEPFPPAGSAAEARELLDGLMTAMQARFRQSQGDRRTGSGELTDELRRRFDPVLAAWVEALERVAAD